MLPAGLLSLPRWAPSPPLSNTRCRDPSGCPAPGCAPLSGSESGAERTVCARGARREGRPRSDCEPATLFKRTKTKLIATSTFNTDKNVKFR